MATLAELEAEAARRQPKQAEATQPAANLEALEAEAARREGQASNEMTLSNVAEAAGGLATESIAGFNKAVVGLLDYMTLDQVNNVRSLMGDEAIPTLSQALFDKKGAFTEGTMAEGLPTDIAAGVGEMSAMALTGQSLINQGAKQLAPMAQSTAARVLKQASTPTMKATGAFGGASGAGEEVGRDKYGETGALIGSIAAPLAGIAALKGGEVAGKAFGKAAINKINQWTGRSVNLVDAESGLPTLPFEKALAKRGLDYGSIVDDIDNLPVIAGNRSPDEVVDQIVRRKLLNGSTDDALATLRLEGNSIVADDLGEEALKQGYRGGDIAAAKTMSKSTKKEALEMLNMNRKILSNRSMADEFRPSDVAGRQVMKRFDYIRSEADKLRGELDRIAKGTSGKNERLLEGPNTQRGLKGLEIDGGKVEDVLNSELNKLNIEIPEGKNALELLKDGAFAGSQISEDKTSQNVIKSVLRLLNEPGYDAARAHNLKRQLDSMLDFNKKAAEGLTDAGKQVAGAVRRSLNDVIREVNPQYAKVNDKLSQSIKSMNNFQKTLGPSIDVFEQGANAAVGQDLRGLLSNRKSRVKLENVIKGLDKTASDLGGDFDVNVRQLVRFANILDNRFGAVADTSLKAEITSGAQQVARGDYKEAIIQKGVESAEKMRGINDTNALNTMHKILKR